MVDMKDSLKIIQGITKILYSSEMVNQRKLLIVSKYNERTRVNLILLRYFLQEMNLRGIFITVDRPHQYIGYLLKLHGIPQKKLLFIDTVSNISGENYSDKGSNVCFMDGPYQVGFLDEIIDNCYEAGDIPKSNVDLKEFDFILIDDIAALAKYTDYDKMKELINSYLTSINRLDNLTAPIVLDINKNKELYEILKNNCEKIILINIMKSIVKEIENQKSDVIPINQKQVSRKIDSPFLAKLGV